ncbi:hypothetical protein HPB48_000516 [Haemaphysalis longicornis]|uniref:Uncharacterized protein n=1 Tax=Haemaphysalis longicornis TaxID=44386 RepID=A0A9J6GTQ3_HAELO|nr:hypothetical protein HPB48_000516 [Haemaphysalis longicornis]
MRLEAASLEKVLAESILTAMKEDKADTLCDLKDVANFVRGKKADILASHRMQRTRQFGSYLLRIRLLGLSTMLSVKTDLTPTVNVAKGSVKRLGSRMVVPIRDRQQTTAAGVAERRRGVRQCREFKI